MAGKAVCFLYVFFEAGYILSFSTLGNSVCQSAIQSTLPSPKFLFQKCGSGCCWQTEEPWEAALGALHMAAVSDQLWNSQPSQQHPIRSAPHAGEQCSHPAWHGDAETGQLELSEKKTRRRNKIYCCSVHGCSSQALCCRGTAME